jgi:hypothetical protein
MSRIFLPAGDVAFIPVEKSKGLSPRFSNSPVMLHAKSIAEGE